jgi:hypothetical protein
LLDQLSLSGLEEEHKEFALSRKNCFQVFEFAPSFALTKKLLLLVVVEAHFILDVLPKKLYIVMKILPKCKGKLGSLANWCCKKCKLF